ncbi:MAG: hypothetical protein NXH75_03375, partial [Halobacteriovoraceae bacterium]|nr:hypothetical protein [Halobacteriovoraceae bacterium]
MRLFGFSFIKDGLRFDYPFREAFTSIQPLVEEMILAVGKNDDGTSEALSNMSFITQVPTVWDMSLLGKGGKIFSEQMNIALSSLREKHGNVEGAWGLCVHSDELIHPHDYEKLKRDLNEAEATGCDAIRFRYLHYWKSHYKVASNKRWYPSEIRALKLDSKVESYGDAQGFSGFTKVYESDVYIHHIGHVRDEKKKEEKQKFLINFIRDPNKFSKYWKREKKAFAKTKTLDYRISHSELMRERIQKFGEEFDLPKKELVYLLGEKNEVYESIAKFMNVQKVYWVEKKSEVPKEDRSSMVDLRRKKFFKGSIGDSMESPLAREWDQKTYFILKV